MVREMEGTYISINERGGRAPTQEQGERMLFCMDTPEVLRTLARSKSENHLSYNEKGRLKRKENVALSFLSKTRLT